MFYLCHVGMQNGTLTITRSAGTGPGGGQMTAEQLQKHPEYPYVHWKLEPEKSGKVEVARGRRGGPFNIYYEVHGQGPIRMVVCTVLFRPCPPVLLEFCETCLVAPNARRTTV